MEDTHYRIKEKIYDNGYKEFIPQYMNGSINGNTYAISEYYGKPIEELPNELYWFDFTIWMNDILVASSFETYEEAFTIIKKDKASKQDTDDKKSVKEIIHLIY